MMLDGYYHDDIVPRVYTGSANVYTMENSDDSTLGSFYALLHAFPAGRRTANLWVEG